MKDNGHNVLPKNVLIVDDDQADVFLTRQALALSEIPLNVDSVSDGIEAIDYLNQKNRFVDVPRPHVILLDLNMPRMNGHQTLKAIKADEAIADIPVIVLTTSDAERDVAETYKNKATCHVTKPLDLDAFTEVMKVMSKFWFESVRFPSHS